MLKQRTVELDVPGSNPAARKFFRTMIQGVTSDRVYKTPSKWAYDRVTGKISLSRLTKKMQKTFSVTRQGPKIHPSSVRRNCDNNSDKIFVFLYLGIINH